MRRVHSPRRMPRLTLSRKVFLALAMLLVLLLLIFAGFSRLGLQRGLGPYVAEIEIRRMDWLAELLRKHYALHRNWNALRADERAWHMLQLGLLDDPVVGPPWRRDPPWPPPPGPPGWRPPPGTEGALPAPQLDLLPTRHAPPPPPDMPEDPRNKPDSIYHRLGLVDARGAWVVGAKVDPAVAVRLPLQQGGTMIGALVLAPLEGLESDADRAFLATQSRFMVWTGVAGLTLALLLSWLGARRWFAPIGVLVEGAQSIAQGRLETRVPVQGRDELAVLGNTFNDMAERLDNIEASRREWLAEVAHELRTPLAAMRAEIEALQDGVRTFDDKTALRLHRQVMRLGQLVDDLRSSMHEQQDVSRPFATVFPLSLLAESLAATAQRFAQRAITVEARDLDALAVEQPAMRADAHRLHQVFMNLLENTLRYTEAGGMLQVGARIEGLCDTRRLVLRFDDSAPGVAPHEMPRLFERLFRGEASRNRVLGGSGLGLAICRAAVEAHGGSIEAGLSPLGGLRMTLTLPLEKSA
jgi:two-component system sensor histidine kinase BaeS